MRPLAISRMALNRRGSATRLPVRSPLLVWFFSRMMAQAMCRDFCAVRLLRPGVPAIAEYRPAIVYMNHPSWWDAAFMVVLARLAFRHRFSVGPIDARQLARYPFMAKIGAFGIDVGSYSGAAQFLRTARTALDKAGAMVWITAEGAFTDPRVRPVRLRPGLSHLVRVAPNALVVPFAVEYPFWNERGAEALGAFGTPFPASELRLGARGALEAELARRLEAVMDDLARAAKARDPNPFETLLEGRSGERGVYGAWRRLRRRPAGEGRF
jgi:1-acyl-sn-glycerol-3-phosphate acyltransferase